jgi:hypothetical protein
MERPIRIVQAIMAKRGTRNEPIARFIEEGINLIVAMLGALKAAKFSWLEALILHLEKITPVLGDSEFDLAHHNRQTPQMAADLSRPLCNGWILKPGGRTALQRSTRLENCGNGDRAISVRLSAISDNGRAVLMNAQDRSIILACCYFQAVRAQVGYFPDYFFICGTVT